MGFLSTETRTFFVLSSSRVVFSSTSVRHYLIILTHLKYKGDHHDVKRSRAKCEILNLILKVNV